MMRVSVEVRRLQQELESDNTVTTWTSGKLDTMSGLCGNRRWVTPICAGCKLDRLGSSYMGVVSCAFLAVSCPSFQRQIQGVSMMTGLRSRGVVVVYYQTSILHVFCNYLYQVQL